MQRARSTKFAVGSSRGAVHRLRGAGMVALALVAAGAGTGCSSKSTCRGSSCADASAPVQNGLRIEPQLSTLTVEGGPATEQFTVTWNGEDVTAECAWNVDKNMGTVDATGLYTSSYPLPRGGSVAVNCTYRNQIAGASILLTYVAPAIIERGAPGDAPADFDGPASNDPSAVPKIVYPFDGVMLPRNTSQIAIQWTGALADRVYRIRVVGDVIDSSFYVGADVCGVTAKGHECKYSPPQDAWTAIAASAYGKAVTVSIAATGGAGQPVADSGPLTVSVSPEDVKGGFYYFSPSINGLKRLPFGATQATDFVSYKTGSGNCAGCHAVSRDGKKVAATFYGGDGTGGAVDGMNGKTWLIKPEPAAGNAIKRWNFATYSPDGALLLTNWAGVLTLRDGTTGARKFDVPASVTGGRAVMPEWSPDGKSVVFVQLPPEGKLGKDIAVGNLLAGDWICGDAGSIAVMPFENGQFGAAQVIVPTTKNGEYHYYPSWSPDSQWILFVTARWPGSSPTADLNLFGSPSKGYAITYDQDTARLRLVSAVPGAAVIELSNATHAINKTTSWPKFAPFSQRAPGGGSLVFITFSAKFDYGFVVTDGKTPQLWMSAIDLDRAKAELGATDPSFPPFWLPFQDPKEKNHSGIWTSDVACSMDVDCPMEFSCQSGTCQPIIPG